MNNPKRIASIALLALLVGIAVYYFGSGKTGNRVETEDETSGSSTKVKPGQATNPIVAYLSAFRTPIEFYGKVVNQHGDPVEGATITLSLHDDPNPDNEEASTRVTLESDREGKFSIKDLKGLSLSVWVTKDGYRTLTNQGFERRASSRLIEYGGTSDQGARFKNPANPTLFTLHEIGPIDPMFYMKETRWRLPVDGTPRRIALDSKDGTGPHQIEFRFTSGWSQLPSGQRYGKLFDWKLEARIPGGGFLDNESEYNFEAPEDGYQESIAIEYFASMPQNEWKRRFFPRFSGRLVVAAPGGAGLGSGAWSSLYRCITRCCWVWTTLGRSRK